MSSYSKRYTKVPGQIELLIWIVLLGALIFFGRWRLLGLSSDAALYAGLAYKTFVSGENWLLSGTENKFSIYFEHPPFFFQWGAQVFKFFGVSEGAARAIGAIPAFVGWFFLVLWSWRRLGAGVTFIIAVISLIWGHYTKYAMTSMLEAPLSLGVICVALASFELHWRKSLGRKRVFWWGIQFFGLLLATASKGVAGLGALGGLMASICLALLFSPRPPFRILFGFFTLPICVLVSIMPFIYWAHHLIQEADIERFVRYFLDQVFKSASTNRGEIAHSLNGERLYYVKIFLKEAFIGTFFFLSGFSAIFLRIFKKSSPQNADEDQFVRSWTLHSLGFLLAFGIPFSMVSFQLPHYLHPVYLLLLVGGAVFWHQIFAQKIEAFLLRTRRIRWLALVLLTLAFPFYFSGVAKGGDRGQRFIAVAPLLNPLADDCQILIKKDVIDLYAAESFALWYFRGRTWRFVEREYTSAISLPAKTVFWNPQTQSLLGGLQCSLSK